MQIMYVLAFLVSIIVFVSTQGRDTAQMVADDARAVATHMATWHRAATEACLAACGPGPVSVTARLPAQVAAGTAFSASRFVSRYDNASKLLVTYMSPGFATRGTVTFGSVNSALAELAFLRGETSHVGIWNRTAGRVIFGQPPHGAPASMPLASPFMGGVIPDGSPVLVARP